MQSNDSNSDDLNWEQIIEGATRDAMKEQHPEYPSVYQARGTDTGWPYRAKRRFTAIPPLKMPERRGAPCRLVKSHFLIRMWGGNDIQPGQLCVAVETVGPGQGKRFDGIHAVRAKLPESDKPRLTVARVQLSPGRTYRLMWNNRENVDLPRAEVQIVGNVVGCYGSDRQIAPFVTLFTN